MIRFPKIRFLNFSPSEGFQTYAHGLVDRLSDLSPSDSRLNTVIECVGDKFRCTLEIISSTVRIKALAESEDARSGIEEARRRAMRELMKWRMDRRPFLVGVQ